MNLSFRHALFAYHLVFTLIFFGYSVNYGGDALGYWTLQADSSQGAETWIEYFGLSTFFIQWLNYIPSKIFQLPFWAGNLIYGMLTAFAWLKLYSYVVKQFPDIPILALKTIFLLPNMHFWTAGVGKESLIWICLVLFFVHMSFDKKSLAIMCLSIVGMFLIRPIYASFLIFILCFWGLMHSPYARKYTYGAITILLGILVLALRQTLLAAHLPDLSWNSLQTYLDFQMQFLGGYQANSYIPMEKYSFSLALFTFYFRPFPWEGDGIWLFMAGVENILGCLLFVTAVVLSLKEKFWDNKYILVYGMLFLILLSILGSQVLNNFGIILRYKSVAMIFLYLWAINTVFSVLKLILAKHFTK